MAEEHKIRRFIKLILSFNIELSKLRLPLKFVMSLDIEIPDTAKLRTPDKRVWNMKVVEEDSHIWLEDGFGEFARYYSIKQGHQVHFEHTSKFNFSVRIFDKSSCQIRYPSQANAPPNPTTRKPETPQKNSELPKFTSQSGFPSPRHFDSKQPFFEVTLKSYNKHYNVMYIPVQFNRRHMVKTRPREIKLKVSDGRQWKVNMKRKNTGRLGFGKGWNVFYEENKLKEGDVCIFEVAKGKSSVFNVYIFVAV